MLKILYKDDLVTLLGQCNISESVGEQTIKKKREIHLSCRNSRSQMLFCLTGALCFYVLLGSIVQR